MISMHVISNTEILLPPVWGKKSKTEMQSKQQALMQVLIHNLKLDMTEVCSQTVCNYHLHNNVHVNVPLCINLIMFSKLKKCTLPPMKANVSAAIMLLIDIKVATSPTVQ